MDAKDKKEKKDRKKDKKKEVTNQQPPVREPENEAAPPLPEDKIIQIPLHLLLRFRNVFEAANANMHWKSQELFPVGAVVRDVDRILAAHMNPGKEGEPGK
tara:strand:+ start:8994 stop:9296 length:303 start_codon:yes stop_codon:yes gene_type:complete